MKTPWRMRFGIWLERFKFLHPLLLEFSHEHGHGRSWYLNRVSRTFVRKDAG